MPAYTDKGRDYNNGVDNDYNDGDDDSYAINDNIHKVDGLHIFLSSTGWPVVYL